MVEPGLNNTGGERPGPEAIPDPKLTAGAPEADKARNRVSRQERMKRQSGAGKRKTIGIKR